MILDTLIQYLKISYKDKTECRDRYYIDKGTLNRETGYYIRELSIERIPAIEVVFKTINPSYL